MSEFKVGDRVLISESAGVFPGQQATVYRVPGRTGEGTTRIRIDGFAYGSADDGHSFFNDDLFLLPQPDIDVRIVYQLEQPARSTTGGWRTYTSYAADGSGTIIDFETLEEAVAAADRMPRLVRRRIVKRTVVTAEKVEVVRDDWEA